MAIKIKLEIHTENGDTLSVYEEPGTDTFRIHHLEDDIVFALDKEHASAFLSALDSFVNK